MNGRVEIIGYIWWPNDVVCAYSYSLSAYDVENMRGDDGKIARREIQDWLDRNAGDFSEVKDFRAEIGTASYGWADPESEFTYSDCMFPECV
jgi:hypothetical protein